MLEREQRVRLSRDYKDYKRRVYTADPTQTSRRLGLPGPDPDFEGRATDPSKKISPLIFNVSFLFEMGPVPRSGAGSTGLTGSDGFM